MIRFGILIISDKGARGERQDLCAAEIRKLLSEIEANEEVYKIIPDEEDEIVDQFVNWADELKLDMILSSGGTGLAPRDRTPDATLRVVDYQVPGMAEAMRIKSLELTPHAMISRAVVGVRGRTLIVNLPGSPKAARENLSVLVPALPHAIEKLKGDPSECGTP
jgi:molybdopterin adenylyltransferase